MGDELGERDDQGEAGLHRPLFARILARSARIEQRKGGREHRARLLAGLTGRVVEIGVGTGNNFAIYPSTVTELLAVEPEANLRAMATSAAAAASVPVRMVAAVADDLPFADGSVDAGVVSGVLCSVPDPARALTELARVIRPGGELRFYEHVVAHNPVGAGLQRLLAATVWPRIMGGCHPDRTTDQTIGQTGFTIESCERFRFYATALSIPVAPRILGRATR
jgi:ubiquinone/menaquinone biosynthesis C-methylase UbiE